MVYHVGNYDKRATPFDVARLPARLLNRDSRNQRTRSEDELVVGIRDGQTGLLVDEVRDVVRQAQEVLDVLAAVLARHRQGATVIGSVLADSIADGAESLDDERALARDAVVERDRSGDLEIVGLDRQVVRHGVSATATSSGHDDEQQHRQGDLLIQRMNGMGSSVIARAWIRDRLCGRWSGVCRYRTPPSVEHRR